MKQVLHRNIVKYLSIEFLDKALPILIISTAIYTLFAKGTVYNDQGLPEKTPALKIKQASQGLILGFYDGVAGPGTGAFWTSSSSALYKINILLSCGLARSTNFISNFFSLLTFIYLGYVNVLLGIAMGIFIMRSAFRVLVAHQQQLMEGQPLFMPVRIL